MASGNTKGKYNQVLYRTAISLRSIAEGERGDGIFFEAMKEWGDDERTSEPHLMPINS